MFLRSLIQNKGRKKEKKGGVFPLCLSPFPWGELVTREMPGLVSATSISAVRDSFQASLDS